jgi:hypothetical protein
VPRRSSFKVSLSLPFGLGGIEQTWEPCDNECRTARELYVARVECDRSRERIDELTDALHQVRLTVSQMPVLSGWDAV